MYAMVVVFCVGPFADHVLQAYCVSYLLNGARSLLIDLRFLLLSSSRHSDGMRFGLGCEYADSASLR